MRSRSLLLGVLAVVAQGCAIDLACAEADGGDVPPLKSAHHKRVAVKHASAKPKAEPPTAPAMAPWAAVDPSRAGAAAPADTAAMPGVHHVVQPDQDRLSYGLNWSSSNATANQYSTQGVFNEVNHDLGAPNAIGTDAEMGMKLHF